MGLQHPAPPGFENCVPGVLLSREEVPRDAPHVVSVAAMTDAPADHLPMEGIAGAMGVRNGSAVQIYEPRSGGHHHGRGQGQPLTLGCEHAGRERIQGGSVVIEGAGLEALALDRRQVKAVKALEIAPVSSLRDEDPRPLGQSDVSSGGGREGRQGFVFGPGERYDPGVPVLDIEGRLPEPEPAAQPLLVG